MKEVQYLAMPNYVCSLDDLPRDAQMAPAVQRIAQKLLTILEALHAVGVFHCDIKPANLFVDSGGDVFLGDYGSIIFPSETVTQALTTPEYTPTEVLSRKPSSHLDFALLAATLADMLAWHVPGKKRLSLYDEKVQVQLELPANSVFLEIWQRARAGFSRQATLQLTVPAALVESPSSSSSPGSTLRPLHKVGHALDMQAGSNRME